MVTLLQLIVLLLMGGFDSCVCIQVTGCREPVLKDIKFFLYYKGCLLGIVYPERSTWEPIRSISDCCRGACGRFPPPQLDMFPDPRHHHLASTPTAVRQDVTPPPYVFLSVQISSITQRRLDISLLSCRKWRKRSSPTVKPV